MCFNVNNPLPTGCWVLRRDLPKLWVFFRYEKLQDLCYNCGILGHGQKDCRGEKMMSVLNSEEPRYGPRLAVQPAKSLEEIVAERRKWILVGEKLEVKNTELTGESSRSERSGPARGLGEERESEIGRKREKETGKGRRKEGKQEKTSDSEEDTVSRNYLTKQEIYSELGGSKKSINLETREMEVASDSKREVQDGKGFEEQNNNDEELQQKIMGGKRNETEIISQIRKENELSERGPSDPTVVDLKQNRPRPGLGPRRIEDLDLIKEDIGLKADVISMDYLSPQASPIRYHNLELTQEEVDKCKKVIEAQSFERGQNITGGQRNYKETAKEKEEELGYYVVFPEDEEGKKDKMEKVLPKEEEMALVTVVNKSLSLKRVRERNQEQGLEERLKEDCREMKKAKQSLDWVSGNTLNDQETQHSYDMMAEEAGLIMPHLAP